MPPTQETVERAQRRPRTYIPGLSRKPDTRSIQIGVICTILVHVLLLWLGPRLRFSGDFQPGAFARPHTTASKFDVEITNDFPLVPEKTPPPLPNKFVETNPESPENIPDNTENFGAKNQQAAQPDPDKDSKLRTPKTEGPENIKNESQFQVGQLQPPVISQPIPAAEEQQAKPVEKEERKKEQIPLPGFMKHEGTNAETFGTSVVKVPGSPTRDEKYVEGDRDSRSLEGAKSVQASKPQRPAPMPRPKLAQVRPGILQNRPQGTSSAGAIGVDAKFSQFGDYLQELIDIVQIQWERVLAGSSTYPPSQSHVTIKFRINSRGEISEIIDVDENAGKQGTYACMNAIQSRAPYRPWTKEMVAILGEDQVITFNFMYW